MEYLVLISIMFSVIGILILVDSIRNNKRDNEKKACKKAIVGISLCSISLVILIVDEIITGNMVKLFVDIIFLVSYLFMLAIHLHIYFKELR